VDRGRSWMKVVENRVADESSVEDKNLSSGLH
jgi:hypothetical protein